MSMGILYSKASELLLLNHGNKCGFQLEIYGIDWDICDATKIPVGTGSKVVSNCLAQLAKVGCGLCTSSDWLRIVIRLNSVASTLIVIRLNPVASALIV
ncbi:hypothetical protein OROGR_001689 [Orobanche gracilis]